MREQTLMEIEDKINVFFKSDKCKEMISEYYNAPRLCNLPKPINLFIKQLNVYIAEIEPHISIYIPDNDFRNDLLFCKNFEGVLLNYKLPDDTDVQEYIGYFIIGKSSDNDICKDGSNLKLKFNTEFIYKINNDSFYYKYDYLTVSDVINSFTIKRKKEIIKNINHKIQSNNIYIKKLKEQNSKYNSRINDVSKWG